MSLFKEWFTHNRSERVGITALACILMLVIVIPSFFPERRFPPENTEELKLRIDAFHAELAKADVGGDHSFTGYANSANGRLSASTNQQTEPELFYFDPNTCDSASFCRMGFSPKQTAVIMRYRAKGGQFRVKEDFKKMFVVSDEMYA
ncbi:MAG: helix-hairpin-helix domain-containing protein, partial [Prevotellaceae bacterium]|nr:helix-hairpin-helix domain-containing protein [Prevotellaceae bacterium]